MFQAVSSRTLWTILLFALSLLSIPADAKYSGGSGTTADPYQIATAADLMALGETSTDYDKHFILTADIDLDPNLPGGKVFDQAVIAPDINEAAWFQGTSFAGVFDGHGHTIRNLKVTGGQYLGLFGHLAPTSVVSNVSLEAVEVSGTSYVGGLVGENSGGSITNSYGTGAASGIEDIGGLVGSNWGSIAVSYSSGSVNATYSGGGLVGTNGDSIVASYSSGSVSGKDNVGGLVGSNGGSIVASCSSGSVSGTDSVGGLVGINYNSIANSYSTGSVNGTYDVGGLVGENIRGSIDLSFWDIETSGWTTSAGGTGKTTAEMQTAKTFLDAGWDFVGETANGTADLWWIDEGKDYPRLWWELSPGK